MSSVLCLRLNVTLLAKGTSLCSVVWYIYKSSTAELGSEQTFQIGYSHKRNLVHQTALAIQTLCHNKMAKLLK